MKNRLRSFAYLLPIIELLFAATMVVVLALHFFAGLKQMAPGSGSVTLGSGGVVWMIPSDRFLLIGLIAFDDAGARADGPVTILNAPAKFVEPLVSLAVARKGYWWPQSLLQSTWTALIYPVYALPAWIYIGFGIDAAIGRRCIGRWNVILSVVLFLICLSLFCVFWIGMPIEDRQGQERLGWLIDGFAIWAVLFSIPVLAWLLQKRRRIMEAFNNKSGTDETFSLSRNTARTGGPAFR